jgi:hypothetical protein
MFAVSRIARLIGVVALTAIAGAASVAKEVFTRKDFNEPKPPRVRGATNRFAKQGAGNRHVHRMARKRKNQARHKAHCRRQRGAISYTALIALGCFGPWVALLMWAVVNSRMPETNSHAVVHVRCVDGAISKVTNSGMATPVLDRTGKAIACPLT